MLKIKMGATELEEKDITDFTKKSRALLINRENKVLVANSGGVYLLPGGGCELNENSDDTVVRELKEETGLDYKKIDLTKLVTIDHYQKNYPKKDGTITNRLMSTTYFFGSLFDNVEVNVNSQTLTDSELDAGFRLELIPYNNLRDVLLTNKTDNHRNKYFVKELLEVMNVYDKINEDRK
ncbi:MAG: NUDIX domain-containing protein [Bacilli bacterium]